ncbi:MAG: cell division protein, partial [Corynebacterium humireducens]|nr:cell division protein [Corynebacterium humireducens]
MSNSTGRFTRWRADWHRMLESRPGFDYFMIRSVVFLLVGIGAVMVMSSTMTWSVLEGATVWN